MTGLIFGDKRISVAYEPIGSGAMNTYLYWGEMRHDPNNNCWGNVMIQGDWAAAPVPYDDWLCVEVMVKLNNPVTASNGALQIWHNGVEVGYWGPGFPNGSWTWDKFIVNANSPAFPGFQWRTQPNLDINYLWIEFYDDQSPNGVSHYIKYDHLVVAKKRIGPIFNPFSSSVSAPAPEPFQIYPNPVGDYLTLTSIQGISEAPTFFYNMLGERVLMSTVSEAFNQIDVSRLRAGAYVLVIPTSDGTWVQRMVKQ